MPLRRDSFSILRDNMRWRVALVLGVLVIALMAALGILNTRLGLADTAFLAWAILAVMSGCVIAILSLPRDLGGSLFFAVIALALIAAMAFGLHHGRPMQHWAYIFPPVVAFLLRPSLALAAMLAFGIYVCVILTQLLPMIEVVRFASCYGLLVCFMYTYALLEARAAEMLRFHSDHDALSNCLNRRTFNEAIAALENEHERGCFLLIDIDHFKSINDQRGHLVGDRVITEVAALLGRTLGPSTDLYRYGGEEFAVILHENDERLGAALAERMRVATEQYDMQGLRVTVSIGVAPWTLSTGSPGSALARADDALYAAKREGRNRVVCAAVLASSAGISTPAG